METFPLKSTTFQIESFWGINSVVFITVNDKKYYLHKDKYTPYVAAKLMCIKPTQGAFVGDDLVVFSNDKIVGKFQQVQEKPPQMYCGNAVIDTRHIYIDGEVPYKVMRLLHGGNVYFSKSNLYLDGNNEPTLFSKDKKFTMSSFDHSDVITVAFEDGGSIDFQYIRAEANKLELLIMENLTNLDIADLNKRGFFEPDFVRRDESYGSYFLNECINMAPNDVIRDELLIAVRDELLMAVTDEALSYS